MHAALKRMTERYISERDGRWVESFVSGRIAHDVSRDSRQAPLPSLQICSAIIRDGHFVSKPAEPHRRD